MTNIMDDIYLNMTEDDIDNLLFGVNVDTTTSAKKNECKNCKGDDLLKDEVNGYSVCNNCGVVNEVYLDDTPSFQNDGGNSSYGSVSNYYFQDSSMGTKIRTKGYSKYNKIVILQNRGQMTYKDKSLWTELQKIQEKCRKFGITQNIIDCAKSLYKKVSESKHTSGTRKGKNRIMRCINRRSMIAACLCYACKLQGEPRTPKEIGEIYDLKTKYVNKGYRKFIDFVDINELFTGISQTQSSLFIKRKAKELKMSDEDIKKTIDISDNIHKLEIASTHEPPSVAAGCILLVSNLNKLNINRKDISSVFKISDVTISKTYRRIYPYHKIVCNNKVTDLVIKEMMKKKQKPVSIDNLVV